MRLSITRINYSARARARALVSANSIFLQRSDSSPPPVLWIHYGYGVVVSRWKYSALFPKGARRRRSSSAAGANSRARSIKEGRRRQLRSPSLNDSSRLLDSWRYRVSVRDALRHARTVARAPTSAISTESEMETISARTISRDRGDTRGFS